MATALGLGFSDDDVHKTYCDKYSEADIFLAMKSAKILNKDREIHQTLNTFVYGVPVKYKDETAIVVKSYLSGSTVCVAILCLSGSVKNVSPDEIEVLK
jgi:hypothetical protein